MPLCVRGGRRSDRPGSFLSTDVTQIISRFHYEYQFRMLRPTPFFFPALILLLTTAIPTKLIYTLVGVLSPPPAGHRATPCRPVGLRSIYVYNTHPQRFHLMSPPQSA